jgi:hypothetical protein
MILNPRFPQILQGNITYNTISRHTEIFDFTGSVPYWYIEVGDIHSLTDTILDEIIPNTILGLLQTKKIKLAIVNSFEGMHNIIEVIYENLILKRKIPEENVIVFSESFSIDNTIAKCASYYKLRPIKSYLPLMAEYSTAMHWKSTNKNKVTQKKYICLNRRWRPHRPALIGLLGAKNLLDDGYVSLISTKNENWNNTIDWIIELNDSDVIVKSLLQDNKDKVRNLPNLVVDLEEVEDYNKIWGFRDYTEPFYSSTYFSVVTETYFYDSENGICVTEKTFRPMCYKHPFIVLARPKFLETIRSLGYQTFDGIIDESYDQEEDNATRMLMVVNEIEKLCKMPIEDLQYKMEQCRLICEHNYNLLLSKKTQPKRKLDNK